MKRFFKGIIGLVLSLSVFACAPLVKTDLKSLNEHPEKYKGKDVIVTADLKSVVENPAAYLGKKIEVTGYVTYKGFRDFSYWNFMLKDEDGRSIRCYEREYHVDAWIWPEVIARRADREHEPLTVVGRLEKGLQLELRWIAYKGQTISTNYNPPGIVIPHQFGFPPYHLPAATWR